MESLADDLTQMRRTPLSPDHVAAIREIATIRDYVPGQYVLPAGEALDRFVYVLEGEVEAVDPYTERRLMKGTIGPTQFVGDITFLSGARVTLPMRAVKATQTLEVRRTEMLQLMSRIPEMSDIIISVMAARRRMQLEVHASSLKIIGADRDPSLQKIVAFADRNKIPYITEEIGDETTADLGPAVGGHGSAPAVIFGKDRVVEDPTPRKIADLLGLDQGVTSGAAFDLLIVGGGPAGVAAGVYAGAEGLSALVVDDIAIGGQAGTSSRIENYMGFPTGISGSDLAWRGYIQALKFGTQFAVPRRVSGIEAIDGGFDVRLDCDSKVRARAVLVATGVQYRRLPLDRLEDFEGAGVYYAATDMEARFCSGNEAAIIGGGNSAGQAAMFLRRHASHVHLLVRGPSLAASMSDYLRSRLEADPNITIHFETRVTQLNGHGSLETITVDQSGKSQTIDAPNLFVMVGAAPNTDWLSDLAELDNRGFVLSGETVGATSSYATTYPGLFAVGDVRARSVKRVASAVGEGSVVISDIWNFLNSD